MYEDLSNYLCGVTSLPVLPSAIDIDLTNVCNQDCFYCNSADFRAKYLVAFDSLEKNSLELYASVRSLYLQDRNRKIKNQRTNNFRNR